MTLDEDEAGRDSIEEVERRYRFENLLMRLVAAGDSVALERALPEIASAFRFPPRHRDELRSAKNLTIVLNTILRKAVEQGGVHPLHIHALSERFAIAIERTARLEALAALQRSMLVEYCAFSRLRAGRGYSRAVGRAVEFITLQFTAKVSLDSLAMVAGTSKAHLCRLFRRETGSTVIKYLNRHRVEEAKRLLDEGSVNVTDVAVAVGFDDPDYFARVFRRLEGVPPSRYRRAGARRSRVAPG
ncbi:MAG: AraC family transcriptional regulator [Spirochaetes bacterium]|nr:AraC family transcriptional regulator [Spirochaetota bacterium]MBU1079976.1 AraC family transcriptional regulator [Spirochaetota bacterium]